MPRLFALATLAVAFTVPTTRADDPKDFFFKPNDRVVFLGDSITKMYPLS